MDFETLKKDNRKKWVIGSLAILMLASTIFFVATRANYRVTEKVNIANGIINYTQSDLSIMAIKVQNSSGGYDNSSSVPTSGYTLSSTSYCEVNGTKDASISMEYKDGRVIIPVNTKNTKCYIFFDKVKTKDVLLANKTIKIRTDFSVVLTENTTGAIYTSEDNDGTTYYFAGAVDNNWVKFGGFYWRIIRINGDGTIRLIYNGTTTGQTGTATQINGTSKFNSNGDNAYVGYMYGNINASTYLKTHANTNSSTVRSKIDNWYNTNLNKDGIKERIDTNAGFCGDRSIDPTSSGTGAGTNATDYKANYRLYDNKTPSLKCTNSNDLYTVSSSNQGNKALTYPVGLITADEISCAGGVYSTTNKSYYLYTNQTYWTMSPYLFNVNGASVFLVDSRGYLYNSRVDNANGVRPVINLRADTQFSSGDGTASNPYVVS